MSEYTYKDVIIDPDDPRVEIGKEYYFGITPKEAMGYAKANGRGAILNSVDAPSEDPFFLDAFNEGYPCLIRKKEPEKKYVPFDLSDAVVREQLWGKRIVINDPYSIAGKPFKREVHSMITGFTFSTGIDSEGDWEINAGECSLNAEDALEYAHFYDETPCGRLVEEE